MSVRPGNVTLVAESILLEEALDRIETDFQKNCNTGLCIFVKCTLYLQTLYQNDKIKTKLNAIIT